MPDIAVINRTRWGLPPALLPVLVRVSEVLAGRRWASWNSPLKALLIETLKGVRVQNLSLRVQSPHRKTGRRSGVKRFLRR